MRNIMGRPAAAALTALALSACGGGGGGGGGGGNLSAHAACHVPAGGPLARPPQPSWIPFSTFSTTATQGIQVIPSAALTTPPVFTSTTPIGSEVQLYSLATDSAGRIVDQLPFALIYSAATADSGTQLFKLPLTGSTLPAAVQIGKLDIGNRAICNIMSMPTDLHDPASAFVMLSVLRDDTAKCTDFGAAADYYKVSYNDDAGTAATLSFGTPGALPLYTAQGALAGLVDVDSDGNIDLYKDSSFSSPKVLVANGKSFANVYYDGRTAYILIASNSGTLDRLDGDGTLTPVYQLQGYDFFMFPSADNANLLMFDGTTNITNILRMPLDGSTPPQLLSTLQQGLDAVQPLGSTSQKIVLLLPGPAYNTTSVASLDLAAPSTPKTILTVGPLQGGKGLVTLDFAGLHGSDLYLNLLTRRAAKRRCSTPIPAARKAARRMPHSSGRARTITPSAIASPGRLSSRGT